MANPLTEALIREKSGDIAGAEALLKQAVQADKKPVKPLTALVEFYLRRKGGGRFASGYMRELLRLTPKSAAALKLAAQVETDLARLDAALTYAEAACTADPKDTEAMFIRASLLRRVDRGAEARPLLDAVLTADPAHRFARREMGYLLLNLGDLEGATAIARALAADYPDDLSGLKLYADANKITADDTLLADARERLLPKLQKSDPLSYARGLRVIAKVESDLGHHTGAFRLHQAAKAVDPVTFDEGRFRAFVGTQIKSLSRADFFGAMGAPDETPVFIVGMPRSGSTLLEQILSAHPQVGGIGESLMMNEIGNRLKLGHHDGPRMVGVVRAINGSIAQQAAGDYMAHMRARLPEGALRGIDKFLHNFERLGLIAKLFPKARVIHATRDPMDNCVSCYLNPLPAAHGYTQRLDMLGRYYQMHHDLMEHWKRTLPLRITTVRYEDVVADTEGQARKLVDFLGLEWDDACLSHQDSQTSARTLSTWQVRQPIYQSSVKRWQRYDEFLGPLKKELAGFYPEGF